VVWTIPSPCPGSIPGVRRCPSSLYTFPARPIASGRVRAWLGIAMSQVPPNLGSSTSRVSAGALKLSSPLRLPVPPRPRGPPV
jgi:hypothetical protein